MDRVDELLDRVVQTLERIEAKDTSVHIPPLVVPPTQVVRLPELIDILTNHFGGREDVWKFSYPRDGTRATLGVGTTDLNFAAGTIADSTGTVSKMSSSLRKRSKEFMQSCALNANQDIVIQFDNEDKIPVKAFPWFIANNNEFQRLRITTTVSTSFLCMASTAPDVTQLIGIENVNQMNVEVRAASGDLTAGETTTAILGLGMFNLAVLQLDVTKITTSDADDEMDFYIQTSYDEGSNWIDLENIHFALADNGTTSTRLIVLGLPQSSAVARAVTDATIADDTKLDLPLGDRIRIKTTVTGATAPTYAYNCVAAFKV